MQQAERTVKRATTMDSSWALQELDRLREQLVESTKTFAKLLDEYHRQQAELAGLRRLKTEMAALNAQRKREQGSVSPGKSNAEAEQPEFLEYEQVIGCVANSIRTVIQNSANFRLCPSSPPNRLDAQVHAGCSCSYFELALWVSQHNLPPQGGGLWCVRQRRRSVFIIHGNRKRCRFISWPARRSLGARGSSPGQWRGFWTVATSSRSEA